MKKLRRFWWLPVVLIIIIVLIILMLNMPDYGVTSKVKNAVLQMLLSHDVPKISVADAAAKKDHAVFLDSRSKEEFDVSHIPNSVYIGYKDFDLSLVQSIPKTKEVIVYCSVGKRSDEVTKKLMQAGFSNVHNLYGGIFEWFNEGHKIVDSNNQMTDTIHAYSKLFGWWIERGQKVY
ncbi:MAG: rhodanese-like domain-containing protein [Bacteroidota bacterium]|nr:rhodanese-like domain-containing protein [Bacteroidota bacterium]